MTFFFFSCFSRPHLGSVPDFRFPVADGPAEPYSSSVVLRRPQKGRLAALRDEPSKARVASPAAQHLPTPESPAPLTVLALVWSYSVIGHFLSSCPPISLLLASSVLLECAFFLFFFFFERMTVLTK